MPFFLKSFSLSFAFAACLISATNLNAASTDVMISEVFPLGNYQSGPDLTMDYVELYNMTDQDINISGWSLQYTGGTAGGYGDSNKRIITFPAAPSIIPAKGFFLVVMNDISSPAAEPGYDVYKSGSFVLNNGGARIALVKNSDPILSNLNDPDLVDRISYGPSIVITPEGSGPAPQVTDPAMSLQRIRNYVSPTNYVIWRDHDDNATDFIIAPKTRCNSASPTMNHVPVTLSNFSLE